MVISGTILQVRWPNQECHNTEERWLVNQVKGQPHQAQLTKRESKECNKIFLKYYSTTTTSNTEMLRR